MIEIKKPKLPSEEILQYIERNRRITIARNGFAGRGYYNCNHPEGKHTPAFHANNGKGDGEQTTLVDIDGAIWVVLPFAGEVSDPVIFNIPVRNRER